MTSSHPRHAFLSTLSLRRATRFNRNITNGERYFYPRSPCGERPRSASKLAGMSDFYPRSPCGERHGPVSFFNTFQNFYPRSPCGERQCLPGFCRMTAEISIHALLAESDHFVGLSALAPEQFLSTLSLRRATAKVHKTVGHFCAYETNFMGIASSC